MCLVRSQHNQQAADTMQVWLYTESDAHALVQSIIRSCHESQDTRVHRAGIHALIAAVTACWSDGMHVLLHGVTKQQQLGCLVSGDLLSAHTGPLLCMHSIGNNRNVRD